MLGEGIGGGGPRRPNGFTEDRVVEIVALGVEFEECVGIVVGGRVGLRGGVEEIVAVLRVHGGLNGVRVRVLWWWWIVKGGG